MTTPPVQNKNTKHTLLGKMKNSSLYFFGAIAIALLAVACKKEESNIGSNLVPDGDKLSLYTYDVPLEQKTIFEDTLKSSGFAALLIGSYNDPIFGRTSASLAAEFKLENALNFGLGSHIDSVVLTMDYLPTNLLPYYGDVAKLNGVQHFKVYELTETLSKDSTYYSNHTPQIGTLWGEKVFLPNFTDTIKYTKGSTTIKEDPQLRITLNQNAINKITNAQTTDLASADAFYNYFKGLYITSDNEAFQSSGQGAILRFDGASDRNCRIRIFYGNATTDTSSTEPYQYADLVMLNSTRRYEVYKHNYNGTEVQTNILAGTAAQRHYIQGLAGVKTKIILPNFDTIAEFMQQGTYVVNMAELVIPVDENTLSPVFTEIGTLLAVAPSSDAKYDGVENPPNVAIADGISIPASYYGGVYDKEKKQYVFRISLHMANILNKTVANKGLYIVCSGANTIPQRVAISNTADRKIHLRLTYTKI